MKQRITAGAEVDLITPDDLRKISREVLQSWKTELARGAKLKRHVMVGDVTGGNVSFGDINDGPADGFTWALTRITVVSGPTLGAAGLSLYVNDTNSAANVLLSNLPVGNTFPGDKGVFIQGSESMRIVGTGISVASQVVVTFGIREVPTLEQWSM